MNNYTKSTLERMTKEELISYSLMLQKNCKNYEESFSIQYSNVMNLINEMTKVNEVYADSVMNKVKKESEKEV